jgi:HNH endonuclease
MRYTRRGTPLKERLESKLDITSDCWNYNGPIRKDGYAHLTVKGKTVLVHRIAYEVFIGPIPDGLLVCHECDNRLCCNPKHLFLGTYQDNNEDKIKKDRHKGKLTVKQANRIFQDERKYSEIAKDYGIHYQMVYQIKAGRRIL